MTIKDFILHGTLSAAQERLEKLTEISAPQIIIDKQNELVKSLQEGKLQISGETNLLNEQFSEAEKKIGRGGKTYYIINGSINFFPAARYGMFIKRA